MSARHRVLIIEDEVLVGIVLEDMLDMLGHSVAANCATIGEASVAIDAGGFDLAIVDVHIAGDPVFPLADRLNAMDIPLIFATGSSTDSLPERFHAATVLEKPYAFNAVEAALKQFAPA